MQGVRVERRAGPGVADRIEAPRSRPERHSRTGDAQHGSRRFVPHTGTGPPDAAFRLRRVTGPPLGAGRSPISSGWTQTSTAVQ